MLLELNQSLDFKKTAEILLNRALRPYTLVSNWLET